MNINVINVIIVIILLFPIIMGLLDSFTKGRIHYSIGRLYENLEWLAAFLISGYLTNKIFFDNSAFIFKKLYSILPVALRQVSKEQHVLTYIVAVPVLMLFIISVLRIITNPFYRKVIFPLSDWIYTFICSMGPVAKRVIGALCQLPRALTAVFIFCLILNLGSYYYDIGWISNEINGSILYKAVNEKALSPILNSSIAQKVPVLLNDSFRNAIPPPQDAGINIGQLAKNFTGGNVRVIEYFNGMTLDEAVKSSDDIDAVARNLTYNQSNDRKKAYAIYKWIAQNIKYDNEKAVKISENPKGIPSGSIVAFNTRKGICFDYSCLYVSMCRAAGLKVRLITGLAYSGISWGDHAWNQVYLDDEGVWINVDATFGSSANYFDRKDFEADHVYSDIQGEW